MATRELPEGKELPIEPDVVRPLIRAALDAALRDLRALRVETSMTAGFILASDGQIEEGEWALPKYDRFHPESSPAIWTAPAARALIDYIWSRRALKLTITNETGEPTQEAWASFTWKHLVLQPLCYLAGRVATEDLTLRREHVQWQISPDDLEDAIAELVGLLTGGDVIVSATCPLVAVHLGMFVQDELDQFELEPGVVLAQWSWMPEQVVFMTRHGHEYRRDEGVWNSRVLRIRVPVPAAADPVLAIAEVVDRIKWAFMIAGNRDIVIHELPIVLRSATGHVRDVLRRGSPNFGTIDHRAGRRLGWVETRGWPVLDANQVVLNRAREVLAALASATSKANDLASVLWAFGRSCVAAMSRDALLDAVVGLERLVVPGERGETTYRFRLHGQAVLAGEGDVFDELGHLYSLRSAAAHGGKRRRARAASNDVHAAAPRARFLLAKAIYAAVKLVESGELTFGNDNDIAAAIAGMVRAKVSR